VYDEFSVEELPAVIKVQLRMAKGSAFSTGLMLWKIVVLPSKLDKSQC
jgi:hypothetical protein